MDNPFAKSGEITKVDAPASSVPTVTETKNIKQTVIDIPKPVGNPNPPLTKNQLKRAKILEEYGGLESNIPLNSQYWQLR